MLPCDELAHESILVGAPGSYRDWLRVSWHQWSRPAEIAGWRLRGTSCRCNRRDWRPARQIRSQPWSRRSDVPREPIGPGWKLVDLGRSLIHTRLHLGLPSIDARPNATPLEVKTRFGSNRMRHLRGSRAAALIWIMPFPDRH